MTPEELALLKPGDKLRYVPDPSYKGGIFNDVVILAHRKADGTGWWNTDGTGLDDKLALLTPHWQRAESSQ